MLVLRYFLYVGGALLALLLACAAVLPGQPTDDTVASAADTPQIRILSERKWPDRVVMDTNAPMPAPVNVVKAEVPAPQPPAADVSAKARMREAYAKLPEQTASDVKKPEPKPVIRRRVARARVAPQPYYGYPQFGSPFGSRRVMAAQQPAQPPRFGFYW